MWIDLLKLLAIRGDDETGGWENCSLLLRCCFRFSVLTSRTDLKSLDIEASLDCNDTTIVLEWVWICRPPGAPRDLTKSCSCAICLFRLLMSCLMMYVSSSISTALSSNRDFLFAKIVSFSSLANVLLKSFPILLAITVKSLRCLRALRAGLLGWTPFCGLPWRDLQADWNSRVRSRHVILPPVKGSPARCRSETTWYCQVQVLSSVWWINRKTSWCVDKLTSKVGYPSWTYKHV